MSTTDPIRDMNDMKKLANYFEEKGQIRNHAIIVVGFATALRITDQLRLTWGDVYNFEKERFFTHFNLTEQKTGKTKRVKLNKLAREALQKLLLEEKKHGRFAKESFVFNNGRKKANHISRVQVWRIIKDAVKELLIEGNIACHSLRKSFGYYAWKYLQKPEVLIMDIYNHSSFNVTKRYLGITQDDLDDVYDSMTLDI